LELTKESDVKVARYAVCALMLMSLAACGGGGSGSGGSGNNGGGGGSGSGATYTVGGSIGGLSASGLVLADNGGDNLIISAGATSFMFATKLQSGSTYDVTVATQPTGATCTVSSGTGPVAANVTSVAVSCKSLYSIGGRISGLSASGLVLADNGGDNLTVSSGATSFTFATRLQSGATYDVTIATQPTGQTCTVSSGTGSAMSDVTSAAVSCAAETFSISGKITNLSAAGLKLQYYSGGETLAVNAGSSTFAFSQPVVYGTSVRMSVVAQPYWQWCTAGATDFSGAITRNITADTLACAAANAHVTTLAGAPPPPGNADGAGSAARFNSPAGVAVDSSGDIYVADSGNNAIRMITPTGVVTTLAPTASFSGPQGVAVDASGTVYVADTDHNEIREISPSGIVSTLAGSTTAGNADGTGAAASFSAPDGIAVDSAGDVFVADTGNSEIRMITPTGVVTTLAGSGTTGNADGTGAAASFYDPEAVAVDSSGNVYVADTFNSEVREVMPGGVVTTLASSFSYPSGVAVDSVGNVYVADSSHNEISKVTPAGAVTVLAGSTSSGSADGTGSAASFKLPFGIAVVQGSGVLYVGDFGNDEIRQITPGS
jgi:sugar lactone lactonase YvrE